MSHSWIRAIAFCAIFGIMAWGILRWSHLQGSLPANDAAKTMNVASTTGRPKTNAPSNGAQQGLRKLSLGSVSRSTGYSLQPTEAHLAKDVGFWHTKESSDSRSLDEWQVGAIGEGVYQSLAQTTGRGDKDKDAYLVVFANVMNIQQRPHVADDIEITLTDELGEKFRMIKGVSSIGHSPMQLRTLYKERLVFRVYSNVTAFHLTHGDGEYEFVAPKLENTNP